MKTNPNKRAHILNSGLAVMRMHGYNGTSINDIVAAAGVPKGSFYNYFESKKTFAIAALQQVAEGNLSQMQRSLGDSALSPLKRFENFFAQNIDHLRRSGQYSGGCFVGTICQEIADVEDALRSFGVSLLLQYQQVFARCLQQAQAQGELTKDVDTGNLAGFVLAAWEGALLKMKSEKSAKPLDEFLQQIKVLLKYYSG